MVIMSNLKQKFIEEQTLNSSLNYEVVKPTLNLMALQKFDKNLRDSGIEGGIENIYEGIELSPSENNLIREFLNELGLDKSSVNSEAEFEVKLLHDNIDNEITHKMGKLTQHHEDETKDFELVTNAVLSSSQYNEKYNRSLISIDKRSLANSRRRIRRIVTPLGQRLSVGKRPAVLLQHGLFSSSASFVMGDAHKAIGKCHTYYDRGM